MESEHALVIQLLPQLGGVGDWDHLSETIFKEPIQGLVTRDRSRRGIILAAKGEQELNHCLRVTVLPLAHVDLDPRLDRCPSKRTK